MKLIIYLTAGFLFTACSNSPLVGKLKGSDSIAIKFNHPGTDSIVKVVETTEPHAIQKMIQFADGKETKQYKCGYDGNIMFYKKGNLAADISFNYSVDGCHHFLHLADGKLSATAISNEAADFLKSLATGQQ